MRRSPRTEVTKLDDYRIEIVGADPTSLDDLVHVLLTVSWSAFLGVIAVVYVALNALFGLAYLAVGGVEGVRGFADAFYFSVQTMGTVGYGAMFPKTHPANLLVVLESLTGLVVTAVATGLVFMRFSRTRPKVRFSTKVTLGELEGTPTLMIRVGNRRRSGILDASARLTIVRTSRGKDGVAHYFSEHVPLVHERTGVLGRALTLRHVIDERSPIFRDTPESFEAGDIELSLAVSGTDETTLQPVHARATWSAKNVVWGARPADMLSEPESDVVRMDLRKFDDVIATEALPGFPYGEAPR
ncbi:MAG: ATP-sensitive inward rectifier potassium channel 10 [Myxococcales bacterium]|jgi:inward rectifier potassium channel|nr:ATP-sensitive inward rectifier potassium channel 10 [Myxococcales bacterium]